MPCPSLLATPLLVASGAMKSFWPTTLPAWCASLVVARLITPIVPMILPSPDR